MSTSVGSDEKPSSGYRQTPILQFFLQEDTATYDDPRGRKRTVPMKVLCLGLPRSGQDHVPTSVVQILTSSLRFNVVGNSNHSRLWVEAIRAKHFNKGGRIWGREEFDQLLGDFSATTDYPCSFLALDLIKAYPEAKVILNKREFDTWYPSAITNLDQITKSWFFSVFGRMDYDFYCVWRAFYYGYYIWFADDVKRNARTTYDQHFAMVRGAMVGREADFLEWEVSDGFGPLCDFLGVDRPKEEFPSGNASKEFDLRVQRALAGGAKRALRNMVGLTFLGVFAGLWAARIIAPDQWRIVSTLRQWM